MSIKITENVTAALDSLERKIERPGALMQDIGKDVATSAQARLKRGGPAPDGSPWKARKGRRSNGILYLSGALARSLRVESAGGKDSVAVTSALPYAAYQQDGGKTRPHEIRAKNGVLYLGGGRFATKVKHPGSVNPARPFVGVGKTEEAQITDTTADYLDLRKK